MLDYICTIVERILELVLVQMIASFAICYEGCERI